MESKLYKKRGLLNGNSLARKLGEIVNSWISGDFQSGHSQNYADGTDTTRILPPHQQTQLNSTQAQLNTTNSHIAIGIRANFVHRKAREASLMTMPPKRLHLVSTTPHHTTRRSESPSCISRQRRSPKTRRRHVMRSASVKPTEQCSQIAFTV